MIVIIITLLIADLFDIYSTWFCASRQTWTCKITNRLACCNPTRSTHGEDSHLRLPWREIFFGFLGMNPDCDQEFLRLDVVLEGEAEDNPVLDA